MAMLYWYMDPTTNVMMGFSMMGMGLFLGLSSFLSLALFFAKKPENTGKIQFAMALPLMRHI